MKKAIVTTTIYSPTEATKKFCNFCLENDWDFYIIGDLKTPDEEYENLEGCKYLSPKEQEEKYKDLSDAIGWNKIMRRNIGLVEAYRNGADLVATIDDDNIPYSNWGQEIHVGKQMLVDEFVGKHNVCDPISMGDMEPVYHRGFPLDYIKDKDEVSLVGKTKITPLIQANLWDGDPDCDAMFRLVHPTYRVDYSSYALKTFRGYAPFNSQNTFLARETIPFYSVLPHVGRMDDIWGGYILQRYFPKSLVFDKSTVRQDRNDQNILTNLKDEVYGYELTIKFLSELDSGNIILPEETVRYIKEYRRCFPLEIFERQDVQLTFNGRKLS